MTEHTSKQYDAELESLRTRVLQMGGLVENQIVSAIEGLGAADTQIFKDVIRRENRGIVTGKQIGRAHV